MKTVNAGAVALRPQFRLGAQPVLHLAPGSRTFIHVTEVGLLATSSGEGANAISALLNCDDAPGSGAGAGF